MAVDAYLAPFRDSEVEQIHNLHHVFKGRRSHILPALIEASDAMRIEILRDVAEANIRDDSICAVGMLSWFLQVKYSSDIVVLEFLIEGKLLD